MASRSPTIRIRAYGPFACFTRPEFKVERVTYEVMTPSAARGLLEAVLWKPAIRWVIERIHVLKPIQLQAIKRNEVNSKASVRSAESGYAAEEDRAQRNTLLLRDVDYIVEAHFEMTERAGSDDNVTKFMEIFRRRLEKGQCFQTPYFGCREFVARVEPAPDKWDVPESLRAVRELGIMLHDLTFRKDGSGTPFFFKAMLDNGRVDVPEVPQ